MEPIEWCRQRLLTPGNPLTVTLPFAPAESRNQILSLRAVITEVAAVPEAVSEPDVGRTKLEWWRRAIREQLPHPAIKALGQTGAAETVNTAHFDALIDGVILTLDNPRFENRAQAWQFCLEVGGPAAILEGELNDVSPQIRSSLATLGAGAYLVRLVRDLAADARENRWLVPLDIQAEFQVSRRDALQESATTGWNGLVRTWLGEGIRHCDQARAEIDPQSQWKHRHLLVQHALDRRLAGKLARKPGTILTRRVRPGPFGNTWFAWRTARRLRRQAGMG